MKILVTPRSFGKSDPHVFKILEQAGIEVVKNETGGIMPPELLIQKLSDCDGIIIGIEPLNSEIIASAKKLKAVAKYGVGVDNIDLIACKNRNIKVSRTVGANSDAVADYAFTLMLSVARKLIPIDSLCRKEQWTKTMSIDINKKTLGLIGLGAIGKGMVKRAKGFDMKVLAYDVFWDDEYAASAGVEAASVERIYKEADFISVHVPLTDETKNMISENQIEMMKPTAVIINTARGGIINENALLKALQSNRIYGAGIDAFEEEPPKNPAWFTLDNVVMGSHCAASTNGAAEKMGRMAANNIIRDLKLD